MHRGVSRCRMNFNKYTANGPSTLVRTSLVIGDKKRTWICEIKLTFVPSCSQMRLQLLHFYVVFKTWRTFQISSRITKKKKHSSVVSDSTLIIDYFRVTIGYSLFKARDIWDISFRFRFWDTALYIIWSTYQFLEHREVLEQSWPGHVVQHINMASTSKGLTQVLESICRERRRENLDKVSEGNSASACCLFSPAEVLL